MGDMTAADRQLIARRLLAATAIGFIIFAIIWFIFIRDTKPRTAIPVTTTGQGQQDVPTVGSSGGGNSNANPSSTAPTAIPSRQSAPSTPPATSSTSTGQSQPSQLAAAGPGDIIALFGSTVIVGTGLHHAFKHRPKKLY